MTRSSGEKASRCFRRNRNASTNRSRKARISAFEALGNRRLHWEPVQVRDKYFARDLRSICLAPVPAPSGGGGFRAPQRRKYVLSSTCLLRRSCFVESIG